MPAPKFIKTITETKGRRMPKPKMEEPKKKPRTKYVERGMERAPLGRPPKPPEPQPIRVAPIDTKELLSAMRDMIKNKRPDEKEQFIVPESPKLNIIRPLPAAEAMAGARSPKEKLKSVEKDIIKQKIVTDFDKILNYVRENGFATAGKISADLGIDKKTVNRYAKVLEENELIKVSYPAIGSMKLIDIDFKPKPKGKDKKAESNK